MERYENYKDSGVEWIGEIPEGWEVKKLKYVASLRSGNNLTSDQIKNSSEYPVYGGNGLRGFYNEFTHEGNFILIGRQGALCGNINYASGKFWATEHAVVVQSVLNYKINWLGEVLRTMNLNQFSVAAAQPGLAVEAIYNLSIPYPSFQEQTAIANYLDRKTAEIDALIAQKERLIALYEEEKTAIINQAVTRGVDPNAKLKDSGIDWLGEIPDEWKVKKLKYVAILKSGNNLTSENINNGKYPVYGGNGLRGYYDKFTHNGDLILIGRQGALCGNINYAKGKFWATDHAVVVQPRMNYKTIWLGEMLKAMNLNQYSVAAAQPGLAVEAICNLSVPYPPLEEQTAIVRHIETESARIDAKIAKTQRIIELQKEYRAALISEVVTGKIKVSHLADRESDL
ncbi:restriction endonuclease subunit S [Candidatus Methylobacter oryzae]|uniref:Restriction endonuclease subunit S n=1 Tax=Candidatus Methylobacter oryzae TaxID=2497749 RepID=A0ABY3CFQ8_9GAMM|nr:restriction endonuclease subunit S [Candidatus Methylobacter oryzae]TRX02593.1 restriction endonuclease subunit S [Candidatus Methylobacter oryzae]